MKYSSLYIDSICYQKIAMCEICLLNLSCTFVKTMSDEIG